MLAFLEQQRGLVAMMLDRIDIRDFGIGGRIEYAKLRASAVVNTVWVLFAQRHQLIVGVARIASAANGARANASRRRLFDFGVRSSRDSSGGAPPHR